MMNSVIFSNTLLYLFLVVAPSIPSEINNITSYIHRTFLLEFLKLLLHLRSLYSFCSF